ncbi:hypothetical protein PFBG_00812 [Plasmodium falciparum 7G8]|uniref:Erythrocyte membrane protein 1 n=2 Tax=Plasmodium falciparum TaxID=5833 RepID=W7FII5_PLAF8|nr:hypothetical protein PFBG_00812 [Plasmodium falciparum 7G8]
MVPPGGRQGGSGEDGIDDKDAKHLLDSIGEKVYKEKVKKDDAKTYKEALKGNLASATNRSVETLGTIKTCYLVKEYYDGVNGGGAARGERYPCKELNGKMGENRFSDTLGGQCTNEKMRSGGIGACAPYRRLHLCHHNLETINNTTSKTSTDTLLAEVCMAAKYEGESLTRFNPKYQEIYSGSTICTVLARSFADIGDIVRGKDLYLGNDKEKDQRKKLEKNLKEIFKNIKKENKSTLESLTDKEIREYWWDANRHTVWEAITCHAGQGAQYFRHTCGSGKTGTQAKKQCRCDDKPSGGKPGSNAGKGSGDGDVNIVPTYFDYVPQFLRWFEEWAEDFCRLRKHKLENAITNCRTPNGKDKYCDLNRHDCEQTIRGDHDFFEDDECHKCSVACAGFVKWIDNQKEEFLKQRNKYENEILGKSRKKRNATTNKYEGYEKKFYGILKTDYVDVDKFLENFGKEKICQKQPYNDESIISINFKKNEKDDIFSHTTYCQACPWCGVKKQNGKGKWKAKDYGDCKPGNDYTNYKETKIPILTGYKGQLDILKKYNKFCKNNGEKGAPGATPATDASGDNSDNATTGYCGGTNIDSSLCEKWTCYYYKKIGKDGGKKDINFCVQQKQDTDKKKEMSMHYNAFFWKWVYHMLHDSLDWRKQLGSCINNNTNDNTCRNNKKCNSKCECFAKWVKQKQQEWEDIKKHFLKQDDIGQQTGCNPIVTLEFLFMNDELLKNIKDTHADAKEDEIKNIEKMLKEKVFDGGVVGGGGVGGSDKCTKGANGKHNTKIDEFLQEELNEAKKCVTNNPDKCEDTPGGRFLDPDSDEDFSEDEEPPPEEVENPCANPSGIKHPVLATKVAHQMQQKAHQKMIENSVKNSEIGKGHGKGGGKNVKSSLVGNIKNATFRNGRNPSQLKEDVCDITDQHTNDSRGNNGGPCKNKGKGLDIGTKWNDRTSQSSTPNVYVRPRREHICTSNLEKIDDNFVTQNTKDHVNDTFLVDVLLAAKEEADYIKNNYKDTNDKEGICRAIRYSFADIGDIIRGRDMWDLDDGSTEMEGHLKKIFNTIRQKLPTEIQGKYKKDEDPYKQLREDWWEANRKQIWDAMTCPTKNGITCDGSPYEDYIPQRLRWMTEWAEWYCKVQKKEYGELVKGCKECKDKRDKECTKETQECALCKAACDNYTKVVREWEEQWINMLVQYLMLDYGAKTTSRHGTAAYSGDVGEKDKPVVAFLQELQKQNSGKTTYDTAAGYIHQELPNVGCNTQTRFCEEKQPGYAFKEPPDGYGEACKCKDNIPKPAQKKEEKKVDDTCKIAEDILKSETEKKFADACALKYGKISYHGWDCMTSAFKKGQDEGACMPPRRRKLYLKYLKEFKQKSSQTDLRTAFIQCAAIETFFAWYKYKEEQKTQTPQKGLLGVLSGAKELSSDNPQEELKRGIIPEEFKRQMFYTYADYRDIFFGKDIGSDMSEVNQKITSVFSNSSQNTDRQRKEFWDKNGPAIWEGMICALSHASGNKENVQKTLIKEYDYKNVKFDSKNGPSNGISLSDFATVPYFIRWFEEWSEEFCRKRKIKIQKIKNECRSDKPGRTYCSGDGEDCENILKQNFNNVSDFYCPSCKNQCTHYNKWMNTKKNEFNKQTENYKKEIDNVENNNYDNYDENFVQTLSKNYKPINIFLKNLKNGPYCNNNNVDGIIDFNNPDDTFSSSKYCVSCPVFGVKCIGNNCIEVTKDKYSKFKGIVSENIKNKGPNNIGILITDNSIKDIPKELENFCKDTGIFEGIRKDEWTCDYVYDLDVCNLSNKNNKKHNNKPISIRILFKRWLEYFLKDYSKLKKKLNSCTNNAEQSICINECQNRCVCAEKWINQKMEEWKIVRERFINQYNVGKLEEIYQVNSVLSQSVYPSDIQNALDESDTLEQLKESGGCPISARSDKIQCEKKDVITILLNKLQENIKSCKDKHDKKTHSNCSEKLPPDAEPQSTSETPTNETYDEYEVEDPFSASPSISSRPDFCPEIPQPEPEPEPLPEEDTAQEEEEEKLPAAPDNSEQEETSKEVVPEKKVPTPPPKKTETTPKQRKKQKRQLPTHTSILPEMLSISSFPLTVGVAFAALSYFLLKKKSKSTIDLLRVIDIPKGEYGIPTSKSKNRYIPYASDRYKGKTYIYMEGDESDDYTYIGDISSSDITSSESEYEDIDINNIYPYKSPKYKTLIDVVLEPSKRDTFNTQSDIPSDTTTNKFTDNEWNQLKQDFISNILQSTQMDLPNENIIDDFMDKGIQPNNPVLDVNMPEKPFITSIHDRDLDNGEEVTYNINFDVSKNINEITNTTDDSKYVSNNIYSGIDLINDSLNSDQHVDIYDELLKRKENEIFGTNHTKHTTTNSIAKQTHTDPILNQLDLFHKWLDRHRNMCEQWNKNKKEELLDKLKEEWNKKNNNNSDLTHTSSNIPSGENSIKNVLNTDVSIQIDMDDPKPINEFTNMDNIIDNLEKNSEPYYDIDEDDIIYFDIDDERTPMYHNNMDNNKSNVPTKVQIEMNVINKQELFQEEFPISDIWNI